MTYSSNSLRLAQLISIKICHDFANPLTAIHNGIELLQDFDIQEDANDDSSFSIVKASTKSLTERIKYYRYAFGMHLSENGATSVISINKIINNGMTARGISFQHNPELENNVLTNDIISIICLASMIMSSHMLYSGTIELQIVNTKEIRMIGLAKTLKKHENLNVSLGDISNHDYCNAPLYLLREIADSNGYNMDINYLNSQEILFIMQF